MASFRALDALILLPLPCVTLVSLSFLSYRPRQDLAAIRDPANAGTAALMDVLVDLFLVGERPADVGERRSGPQTLERITKSIDAARAAIYAQEGRAEAATLRSHLACIAECERQTDALRRDTRSNRPWAAARTQPDAAHKAAVEAGIAAYVLGVSGSPGALSLSDLLSSERPALTRATVSAICRRRICKLTQPRSVAEARTGSALQPAQQLSSPPLSERRASSDGSESLPPASDGSASIEADEPALSHMHQSLHFIVSEDLHPPIDANEPRGESRRSRLSIRSRAGAPPSLAELSAALLQSQIEPELGTIPRAISVTVWKADQDPAALNSWLRPTQRILFLFEKVAVDTKGQLFRELDARAV